MCALLSRIYGGYLRGITRSPGNCVIFVGTFLKTINVSSSNFIWQVIGSPSLFYLSSELFDFNFVDGKLYGIVRLTRIWPKLNFDIPPAVPEVSGKIIQLPITRET